MTAYDSISFVFILYFIASVYTVGNLIAVTPDSFDREFGVMSIELFAYAFNKIVNGACVTDILVFPDICEKLISCKYTVFVCYHKIDKIIFHSGEIEFFFTVFGYFNDAAFFGVDLQIAAAGGC